MLEVNRAETQDPGPLEDLTCGVCFDTITPADVYPQPCNCRFTMCWGCVHLQHHTGLKRSQCPCCRAPNRYESRNAIIDENSNILTENRGFSYHVTMNRIDTQEEDLCFLEDVIISANYMRQLDPDSQCLVSLRRHPSMRRGTLPSWARKQSKQSKLASKLWGRLLGVRGSLRVVFVYS